MKQNDVVIGWLRKLSAGTTDEIIQLETRSKQEIIEWHLIGARNDTDSVTLVEIGLKRNTDNFLLKAAAQSALGKSTQMDVSITATGDYHPYAIFSDPDSGDILELYAFGHVIAPDDEPTPG